MKYSGTIFGFVSSYGSIYNIITDDNNCYVWKGKVSGELKGKMLLLNFICDGRFYEIKATILKEHYYTGSILCDKENCGKIFLSEYRRGSDILFKGDFIEDEINYDCFLEMNLIV